MKGVSSPAGNKFFNRGDPATSDFDDSTIDVEEAWTDLSLSSIIPPGTTAVLLSVLAEDAGGLPIPLRFRPDGNSNEMNISMVCSMMPGIGYYHDLIVPTKGLQVIEYYLPENGISIIHLTVKGWWK
jgi:hypothetical protein